MRYTLGLASNGDLVLVDLSDVAVDPKAPGEPLVLLHNVQQLDIGYFGVVPPDKAPAWHDTWQGRPVLPLLMRIRVQFPADDRGGWPELLIKPFAMVDTMCVHHGHDREVPGPPMNAKDLLNMGHGDGHPVAASFLALGGRTS